jgi:BirA family transcriptional regulator, biotin operon repressor / biotin---[acetyl-CoA-carboxylase] ligase
MIASLKKANSDASLDVTRIQSALAKQAADISIEIFDQLDSTNTYLMQLAQTGACHASCVAAESQLAGRGRHGRAWQSAPGGSLTFSLLWRFEKSLQQLEGLSLAVGVALVRALRELGVNEGKLKWPNDILHHFHKLAGVLIETGSEARGKSYAVIGVGINIQLPEVTRNKIGQAVTDWASIIQTGIDRNILLAGLLLHLSDVLNEFEKKGLMSLREEWLHYHAYQNKDVRLVWPDGSEVHGRVIGIAENGALLLATSEGEKAFSVGEISLRAAD